MGIYACIWTHASVRVCVASESCSHFKVIQKNAAPKQATAAIQQYGKDLVEKGVQDGERCANLLKSKICAWIFFHEKRNPSDLLFFFSQHAHTKSQTIWLGAGGVGGQLLAPYGTCAWTGSNRRAETTRL